MTPACESNAVLAAMKKSDENKFKAICTGVREDGAYVQAGENDNLIVQKIEQNTGSIGIFGYSYLEENQDKLKGIAINGVAPSYQSISTFKYPGARPLYVYVKNAHANAIPAVKAFVAEFTKESTFGPNGYLRRSGLIAAPNNIRARSQQASRSLSPLNLASLK
jgi:phosphate transport system substrate-binding protein